MASFGRAVRPKTIGVPEVLSLSSVSLSIKTLVELYSLSFMSIPSTNLEACIIRALLACPRHLCQIQTFLFLLTRCVGLPLLVAMARFLTFITVSDMAQSRIMRFQCCLACAITTPCLINVMWLGLSWNIIPVFCSCPREIRFESYSGTSIVSSSLIDFPSARGIETVPISSEQMIFFLTVTKSIDIS